MKTKRITYLDFEIDKLTRSIENVVSGDSFQTEVSLLTKDDLKQVTIKNGWRFKWKQEFDRNDKEVYKLTILSNPTVIQGLVSLRFEPDHLYMPLIESASFNIGKSKIYLGVPGNLVAYACKLSFQRGYEGFVSFHSKTVLIDHYAQSLGAYHFGGHLLIIDTNAARKLIDKYFKS